MENEYNSQICEAMDRFADGENEAAGLILDQCISDIKTELKNDHATEVDFYYWGMCLQLMEEPEQALLKFERVIQISPEHEDALWQITSILFYTNQSANTALSILENKLLKINPTKKEYLDAQQDIKIYLKHTPKTKDE